MDFLFMSTIPNTPITKTPPVNPEYSALRPAQDAFGKEVMTGHFSEIRKHCPRAFNPESTEDNIDDAYNRYIQYMTQLTSTYHENSANDVSVHASLLILELFGLFGDTRNAEVRHRGFYTLLQYREKALCAEYILEGLDRVRSYHNAREALYTVEQLWSPPTPGLSLYLFRGSAPIYMPFAWIWQCVVIAKESEGGASRMWFNMLVDHTVSENPTCSNYMIEKTGMATVREKLQYSAEIFKLAETVDGEMFAKQILNDINLVLNQGVDALHIPALADIFCLLLKTKEDASCQYENINFLYEHSGDCWKKNGRSLQNRINEQAYKSLQDATNLVWINVVQESRKEILGDNFELYENFMNANLKMFVDEKVIDIIDDVSDQVNLAQNHIPRLKFVKAEEFITAHQGNILKSYDSSNLLPPTDLSNYAIKAPDGTSAGIEGYTAYSLREQEFRVARPIEILPQHLRAINYLTPHLAKFLLVKFFLQHIYSTQSFILGSMVPDATTSARMYTTFNREKWSNMFEEARSYDDFMHSKKFECKDDVSYKPTVESNRLHRSLRTCVQKMQVKSGWQVPEGSILHVILSSDVLLQGFFPSFMQTADEPGFLEQLFSDKLAAAVDTRNNICFQDRGLPKVMNPYWAGHFDYRTGCDVDAVGDYQQGLRRVDGVCTTTSPDETCAERFPEFAEAILKDMAKTCQDLYAEGTVFTTPPSSSTKPADGEPLCERRPMTEQ